MIMDKQKPEDWVSKFFKYLKSVLDKYLQQFERYEELTSFMEDENNLYNKDGSLTVEYQNWIKRFEVYCMDHPIDEFFNREHIEDEKRIEVLRGAKEYISQRRVLKGKYANAESGEDWLNSSFDSEEKKKAFEVLVDNELENILGAMSADNK